MAKKETSSQEARSTPDLVERGFAKLADLR